MVGILIELIASWLVLWAIERQNLSPLGLYPSKRRAENFFVGLGVATVLCATYQFANAIFTPNYWEINTQFTVQAFFYGAWWTMRSVLFEELIFRGALLYIAIQKIGTKKACYLSAVCFGIYHWFSFNAWGNPVQMLIIFLMTGVAGLMYAFSFAVTKSLYLPIGIHFGWNFVSMLFSNGPLGKQLFFLGNDEQPQGLLSLAIFLFQVFATPLIITWYLKKMRAELSSD